MEPKRLGLLRDLAPGASLIGTLVNPNFPPAAHQLQQLEEAARTVGQRIIVAKASDDDALETAFASLVRARVADTQASVRDAYEQAMPPEQSFHGLSRYLRRRARTA